MFLLLRICLFVLLFELPHAANATTIRIKFSWVLNDQYAGQLYAYNNGWYKKDNIELVLMPYKKGTDDPYSSVVSGKADIGVGDTLVALRKAINDKSDIVIFGVDDQISPAGFLSLAEKNIKQPKNLEARIFGYYNDADTDLLKWYAEKNDINFDSIKKLKITPNDMEPLIRNEVDFIIAHETNEPVILKLKNYSTNFISLSGPKGLLLGPAYFCKRGFFEKNVETLKKFIKITSRGWQAAITHPRKAAGIIINYYPQSFYINGSKKTTMDKFVKGLGIKKYYLTYKVGLDCICYISKLYWELVKERLISESMVDRATDIMKYVRFDAAQALMQKEK